MYSFHPPIILAQSNNFIIVILQNCLSSFELHKVKAQHAATTIKFR